MGLQTSWMPGCKTRTRHIPVLVAAVNCLVVVSGCQCLGCPDAILSTVRQVSAEHLESGAIPRMDEARAVPIETAQSPTVVGRWAVGCGPGPQRLVWTRRPSREGWPYSGGSIACRVIRHGHPDMDAVRWCRSPPTAPGSSTRARARVSRGNARVRASGFGQSSGQECVGKVLLVGERAVG